MTAARHRMMPSAAFDVSLPLMTRRAALLRWWDRQRRAAARPRWYTMVVLGPDGREYESVPPRPLLADSLLALAAQPRPLAASEPPPPVAAERWAALLDAIGAAP